MTLCDYRESRPLARLLKILKRTFSNVFELFKELRPEINKCINIK